MSTISLVSPGWLALRAAADDGARSRQLAEDAARLVGLGAVVVHDLGSGTGAMMRWMAPRLPGPQTWILHDGDPGILGHIDPGPTLDAAGIPITVRTSVEQLVDLRADAFAGASLVTASALLDVVTREEAQSIVDGVRRGRRTRLVQPQRDRARHRRPGRCGRCRARTRVQ